MKLKATLIAVLALAPIIFSGNVYAAQSTTVPVPHDVTVSGDINGDGKVDITDLSIFLSNWGTSEKKCDLNHDGTVNVFDLSVILSNWTVEDSQ